MSRFACEPSLGSVGDEIRILDGFADPRHAAFFKRHYADRPIRFLPPLVVARLIRQWRARDDLIFAVAESGGTPAGFIFGQSVGAKPWRQLLRDPLVIPFAGSALLIERLARLRRILTQRRQTADMDNSRPFPPYENAPNKVVHDWGAKEAANVEFIFVHPDFRGRHIAGKLLEAFEDRARRAGIPTGLAYIAPTNNASVNAFRRAGWSVYREGETLRAVRTLGPA